MQSMGRVCEQSMRDHRSTSAARTISLGSLRLPPRAANVPWVERAATLGSGVRRGGLAPQARGPCGWDILRAVALHQGKAALVSCGAPPMSLLRRVPISCTLSKMAASSSADHSALLTAGLRWLYHRSRHCFPDRPPTLAPGGAHGATMV